MQVVIGKTSSSFNDKNDCTVRCLANLTDLEYEDAKELMSPARKSDRRGSKAIDFVPIYEALGIRPVATCGTTTQALLLRKLFHGVEVGKTVHSFIEKCDKNKSFAVLVKGHIFAVVGGVIHDTLHYSTLRNMRVVAYFEKAE